MKRTIWTKQRHGLDDGYTNPDIRIPCRGAPGHEDESYDEYRSRYTDCMTQITYEVTKAQNIRDPKIGDVLTCEQVDELLAGSVVVNIV